MYFEAKQEALVTMYRHTLLTAEQLGIILHYSPKTIYNLMSELKREGLIRSVPLPFLKRNHVGYTLTVNGARGAAGLAGDETVFRAKSWVTGPMQIEHYYGTNAFFTELIHASLPHPDEGLIEWLDPRSAAERYVQSKTMGKKSALVKPDGFGMYRFPGLGRLAFHLEYDTGTETLWRLKEKMLHYGLLLPTIWANVDAVQVLFVTKLESRSWKLLEIWEALQKGTFRFARLPNVWAIAERDWRKYGEQALWLGNGGQRIRLRDMPLLPLLAEHVGPILGKQPRDRPPILIRR
ncbi:replication-relaxation family protein [Cohnella zeiphila]|uniref:Replication-relaxation family protein n=1 Tax=Cohnella zeiphila TaxID=2761120 RepID=A0A7X0VYB9_9BACL|nr:replication-relaxation family protein [Cohnella zeiphila]MBB6732773.1 replication-relaxation family protein [Cohnella zeiphila]